LVRGLYVRGLSTQDVRALYRDTLGGSRLSKSEPCDAATEAGLCDLAAARSERPADHVRVSRHHAARQGTDEKEGVLSAYAPLEDGRPVLPHLVSVRGNRTTRGSVFGDFVGHGLRTPLLVVMDGAAGLVKGGQARLAARVSAGMSGALCRRRHKVHKIRNILAKLPRLMQPKMKGLVQQVFLARVAPPR
jgi:transposase-like protein